MGRRPLLAGARDLQRQYAFHPFRCQAMTVLGLNDEQRLTPVPEPATSQDPEATICVRQPRSRVPSLENDQLLAQA